MSIICDTISKEMEEHGGILFLISLLLNEYICLCEQLVRYCMQLTFDC